MSIQTQTLHDQTWGPGLSWESGGRGWMVRMERDHWSRIENEESHQLRGKTSKDLVGGCVVWKSEGSLREMGRQMLEISSRQTGRKVRDPS